LTETAEHTTELTGSSDRLIAEKMIKDLNSKRGNYQNTIQWQMDLSITVADILKNVSGMYYDKKTKQVFVYESSTLNSTGFLRLAEILHSYLNKDSISSNLQKKDLLNVLLPLSRDLKIEFYLNNVEYGLDMKRFMLFNHNVLDPIYLALTRALDDGTRKHNETAQKITETVTQRTGTENKSNPFMNVGNNNN